MSEIAKLKQTLAGTGADMTGQACREGRLGAGRTPGREGGGWSLRAWSEGGCGVRRGIQGRRRPGRHPHPKRCGTLPTREYRRHRPGVCASCQGLRRKPTCPSVSQGGSGCSEKRPSLPLLPTNSHQ